MKKVLRSTCRLGWRIVLVGILLTGLLNAVPIGTVSAALISYEIFSLQIHLPEVRGLSTYASIFTIPTPAIIVSPG